MFEKNAPNAVRFHVNISELDAKALFGRGFRGKTYRILYRFAAGGEILGEIALKAVRGLEAVHTLDW